MEIIGYVVIAVILILIAIPAILRMRDAKTARIPLIATRKQEHEKGKWAAEGREVLLNGQVIATCYGDRAEQNAREIAQSMESELRRRTDN